MLRRRQFLKGSAATALLAGTHVLSLGARPARASASGDPVLVLVNLRGGNDALNTVVPLDDVGAPQRSLYELARPTLRIPVGDLAPMTIDPDPALGTGLALNPRLTGFKALYDQGRLAVVNGVGVQNSSLSHFRAEDVWYSGDPDGKSGAGWVGRHIDTLGGVGTPAISFGAEVSPSLVSTGSEVIGARRLSGFELPDDPDPQFGDLAARRRAWEAIFADTQRAGNRAGGIAESGGTLLRTTQLLPLVQTSGWSSRNETERSNLGQILWDVASILRHDDRNPGQATGLRFFHTVVGRYDTHSRQGSLEPGSAHGGLMSDLSRSLSNFQQDLDAIGVADRVVTLIYSEFGRRVEQNAPDTSAGTDHGRAGTLFVVGTPVAGGVYGRMPRLDRPDPGGNLVVTTDFRRVYATLIDDWLGGDHHTALPGAPFAKLPLIS